MTRAILALWGGLLLFAVVTFCAAVVEAWRQRRRREQPSPEVRAFRGRVK